jgi:hypothetical protein
MNTPTKLMSKPWPDTISLISCSSAPRRFISLFPLRSAPYGRRRPLRADAPPQPHRRD